MPGWPVKSVPSNHFCVSPQPLLSGPSNHFCDSPQPLFSSSVLFHCGEDGNSILPVYRGAFRDGSSRVQKRVSLQNVQTSSSATTPNSQQCHSHSLVSPMQLLLHPTATKSWQARTTDPAMYVCSSRPALPKRAAANMVTLQTRVHEEVVLTNNYNLLVPDV